MLTLARVATPLVVVLASTAALAGEAPESDQQVRLALEAIPVAGTVIVSDGHFSGDSRSGGGLAIEYLRHTHAIARYGAALHYELDSRANPPPLGRVFLHFVHLAAVVAVGLRSDEGLEVEAALAFGPWLAALEGGETSDRSRFLHAFGPAVELAVNVSYPVARNVDLTVGAAGRGGTLSISNGSTYFGGSPGLHFALPIRVGVRLRL
jgi:hypothetical protein